MGLLQLVAGWAVMILTAIFVHVISMRSHVSTQNEKNENFKNTDTRLEDQMKKEDSDLAVTMKESVNQLKDMLREQEKRLDNTLGEMGTAVKDLTKQMGRFIEIVVRIQEQNVQLLKVTEDHEARIREFERKRNAGG